MRKSSRVDGSNSPVAPLTPLLTAPPAPSTVLFAAFTPVPRPFCAAPVAFPVAFCAVSPPVPAASSTAPVGAGFLFCGLTAGGKGFFFGADAPFAGKAGVFAPPVACPTVFWGGAGVGFFAGAPVAGVFTGVGPPLLAGLVGAGFFVGAEPGVAGFWGVGFAGVAFDGVLAGF